MVCPYNGIRDFLLAWFTWLQVRSHASHYLNFEVLNLEVDCKEAEQKLLELFFKLDHDKLTLILLAHLFWKFQSTFKL